MNSILRVVGLGGDPHSTARAAACVPLSARGARGRGQGGRARSAGAAGDPGAAPGDPEALLPNLAAIAAATEPGILALEEEAKGLERAPLPEALELVRRWSQALRRRPRPDEPLASFKVQFLRSNALERALEGLRRNEALRSARRDPPLFAVVASGPEEALLAECQAVLQLCLPRAAAPLAAPLLRAALEEPPERVTNALTATRALKEDWMEVVRDQAEKGLRRRLDDLDYKLQKAAAPQVPKTGRAAPFRDPTGARKAWRDRVLVPKTGRAAPFRDPTGARKASRDRVLVLTLLCEVIGESQRRSEAHSAEMSGALRAAGAVPAERQAMEVHSDTCSQSSHSCGVTSVTSRSAATPGLEEADLLRQRADLAEERRSLLERLRAVEQQVSDIDTRLGRVAWSARSAAGTPAVAAAAAAGAGGPPSRPSTPSVMPAYDACSPAAEDLTVLLARATAQMAGDAQRVAERQAAQLHKRRAQLLSGLSSHLEGEQARLEALTSSIPSAGPAAGAAAPASIPAIAGAAALALEQLDAALLDCRELCGRVEALLGAEAASVLGRLPRVGQACRAKWLDGNFYDATVSKVLGDGTAVVNWLRPRPAAGPASPSRRPLVTVSEGGGDDTVHRIVAQADLQLENESADRVGRESDTMMALRFFSERPPDNQLCLNCCKASTEFASVSFGIYLCRACAEGLSRLGSRCNLVKPLNDGWGWLHSDLEYLRKGGNAAFREALEAFPVVASLPLAERYASRFAEYYRKRLDALRAGLRPPPLPSEELAAQPGGGDFLSAAEAASEARQAARRFEEALLSLTALCRSRSWAPAGVQSVSV